MTMGECNRLRNVLPACSLPTCMCKRNGWLPGHERLMVWIAGHDFVAAPRDIASKHGPHAAVKLTHILPSGEGGTTALKAVCVWLPAQLG